jgi:protein-tyrosine phosphatase
MDNVATNLFVGTIDAVGEETRLRAHEITTIVSLTHGELPNGAPTETDVHRHPLIDGPQADLETFEQAVDDVVTALKSGEDVLVCCSAGASRSPAVAATALALTSEIDLGDAFKQVSSRRSIVDPHEALFRHAARVYTQR